MQAYPKGRTAPFTSPFISCLSLFGQENAYDKNISYGTFIKLYEYYGVNFVKKLRGMFSIIIFDKIKNKIVIFQQKMFYYKLNLFYKDFIWAGSKAVKFKNFKSPQWLRNIKSKKYPAW